ncbi:hypothetical protein J7399_11685 [Shimia sp. R9_1]|uniref:hypothetical protein n=1 Tax=unclassified Shimia TaxID=2630038 RepID=UPI001ADC8E09|nr:MULTISPECIES: hypothetical protein [unclassified Shimia]MBO9396861.1 hypothetical protein [Shimia sp. R9_2]MBO9401692.1 hypothetical protein [Shimia sp. R9_3]MBO9408093.1 hypothetical protein [Shimia sp. R9_1]
MSVSFKILSSLGVVYVRYEGFANMSDTLTAFAEYAQHPEFRPGQKQLVDLTHLTGWDEDFLELMKIQAQKADAFTGNNAQTLIVYLAPTPAGQKLARIALRSWEPFPAVVPMVQEKEQPALSILGLPYDTINQLLSRAV